MSFYDIFMTFYLYYKLIYYWICWPKPIICYVFIYLQKFSTTYNLHNYSLRYSSEIPTWQEASQYCAGMKQTLWSINSYEEWEPIYHTFADILLFGMISNIVVSHSCFISSLSLSLPISPSLFLSPSASLPLYPPLSLSLSLSLSLFSLSLSLSLFLSLSHG